MENKGIDAQQRHKRYLYQESEIAAFQRAFNNKEKTLAKFDIKGGNTLDKIMERSEKKYEGSPKEKLVNNPIVFDGSPSCYEGIVLGIFETISKLKAAIANRDELISSLRQELHDCQEKRCFANEEAVIQELLSQIK